MSSVERSSSTAARAAPRGGAWRRALLFLALLGPASGGAPARAAPQAHAPIDVTVHGIAIVTSLAASPGSSTGTISLSWTEPERRGDTAPDSYDVRVSSIAQIDNDGEFNVASPLSAVSPTPVPSPGPGGGVATLLVQGLTPGVTYYFGMRESDSGTPKLQGPWIRNVARGWNVNNYVRATYLAVAPDAITDLTAAPAGGGADLTWTAPGPIGAPPLVEYVIHYSTHGVADFGGDANAWYAAAPSSAVVSATTLAGSTVTLHVANLPSAAVVYFGIESQDVDGRVSLIDTKSAGVGTQAQVLAVQPTDLLAVSGATAGSIQLSWTEPLTDGMVPPIHYDVRASSQANIGDDAQFAAAAPLSAFSPASPPSYGAGGSTIAFSVTGLSPDVTYYFALHAVDAVGGTTHWGRSATVNATNFAAARFVPEAPDPITDLAAAPGAIEGQIRLSWTAPRNQNLVAISSYTVRYATFSAASLAGDTTAWFNAAPGTLVVFPAESPGSPESVLLNGLYPSSTFYFGVKAVDAFGETAPIDTAAASGLQVFAKPLNLPPATPAGLSGSPGLARATISWTDLTPAGKGLDFVAYRLYRSTLPASNFALAVSTSGTAFFDHPLTSFVTYYYRVSAIDSENLESPVSSTISVIPFTLGPQEPFGFAMSATSTTATIRWSSTTRYADGESFADPAHPSADELLGYEVFRSTDICAPFSLVAVKATTQTAHTDNTGGLGYYYQVRSFNSLGLSTGTPTIDLTGTQFFPLEDCQSRAVVDNSLTAVLSKSSNTYGQDILLARDRVPQEIGNNVIQAVEFRPLLAGTTEIPGFHFAAPIRIQLHFATSGGIPVPMGLASAPPAAGGAVNDLGIFWFNGIEYKKLYGTVDPLSQTVTVQTPNVGKFQIRTMYRDTGVTFDISNITSRIFSPNGDGLNDDVIFIFDNPNHSSVDGRIYDLRGSFVANMTAGPQPDSLMWDGRMNGRYVSNGVYLYEIRAEGKAFNGTVVVAR